MNGRGIGHGLVNIAMDSAGTAGGVIDKITDNKVARPIVALALGVPIFVSCLPVHAVMHTYYYAMHRYNRTESRYRKENR